MKIKKLITGAILATTLAIGVGVGVASLADKKVEAEPAAADTTYWNVGDVIYVRVYDGFKADSATAYANYPDGNGQWHSEKMTTSITTKGSETLYKYTFTYAAASFQVLRKNSTGSDQWGYTNSFTTHSTNLFEVTGYGGGQFMNANFASASVVNVSLTQPSNGSISVKNKNGSQNGAGYYYSDWTLEFTATANSGYYFGNWTDAAGNDWSGSDRFNNPAYLSGLAGDFGVSCKILAYSSRTWKVLGNSTEPWDSGHQNIEVSLPFKTGSDADGDGPKYYTTSLSLTAGAVFKVVDIDNSVYYGYDCLESGSHSAKGTNVVAAGSGVDPNIKVVTSGTYEIYMKIKTGTIWMQVSSQTEANVYGEEFLSVITCSGSSKTFNINDWNNVSGTSSMEYKFSQLTSGARSYLSGLSGSESGSAAERAIARYDYILSKYGYGTASGQLHDFMGRKPAKALAIRPVFGAYETNSTNTLVIIVIASLLSVSAVGGYFFLRRRKEN